MVPGYETGRYRMRERLHLPQFISPKNPFAVEATGAASVEPPTATETTPVVSAETSPSRVVTRARKWSVAVVKVIFAATRWSGAAIKRGALWCLDHNPFSSIGRPRLPAIPRFGRPPVQEELSLDKVAVMRGDLEHADLEVVRAGGRSGEESSAAWRSLTARVFGGGAR